MLFGLLLPYLSLLWSRLRQARSDDRGMTTEAMIVTALLAAAAVAAVGLIANAIEDRSRDVVTEINDDGAG